MDAVSTPLPRRLAEAAETAPALEPLARALRPLADAVVRPPSLAALLRGAPLGHAAHPLLTDLPIGLWVSSTVLDLVGTDDGRSADRLLGLGVLATVPTVLTGLADWQRGGDRVRTVGALHAALNTGAVVLYAGSWLLRRRGHRGSGVAVSLAAGGVAAVSGYLGGHMVAVLDSPDERVGHDTSAPEPATPGDA
ncbi:DUF2231 domain-containing protein [Cellulomonas fengjieae]|uniref:DUF2231 domain-containing protein n=1 Tax=Cellulomonas fengjieae TaxID=2819978 RepID=UPI001AAE524C|nr:DUF2231 domain-containing protein [Cellulomonas fengjieae]MBO3102900.1 DUF2231 domain-containing protein [Cellulomonas fengjieae]